MSKLTMHPIRGIRDHDAVMARIHALAAMDPKAGSPAGDELEVLSLLVRAYEEVHFPIAQVTLDDAIIFRAEQMGLSPKELDALFGGSGRRSEVLAGKRALSKGMATRLRAIGVPDGLLLRLLIGDDSRRPATHRRSIRTNGARSTGPLRPIRQQG
ncbi:MAG: transcriptional regulator [Planctomycetes bacterium]|nr:transcriptional regulator [Planctomycetota bacterium]